MRVFGSFREAYRKLALQSTSCVGLPRSEPPLSINTGYAPEDGRLLTRQRFVEEVRKALQQAGVDPVWPILGPQHVRTVRMVGRFVESGYSFLNRV